MYESYKRKTGATQPQNYYAKCDITSDVVADFFAQPGYVECYKNNLPDTTYDIIVMDGDKEDKTVGYKRLLSYPYSTVQFAIGDYVHFDYGGAASVWILSSLDKQFPFEVNGKILKCNITLNWIDADSNTISYPCSVEAFKFSSTETVKENNSFRVGDGKRYLSLQLNSDTQKLRRDKRFIFDNRAWRIVDIDTTHELVQLCVEEHQINTFTDDVVNEIADAYIDTTPIPVHPTSGITGDATLPIGQTSSYSIIGALPAEVYLFSLSNSNATIMSSTNSVVKIKAGNTIGSTVVLTAQHSISLVQYTFTITISPLW